MAIIQHAIWLYHRFSLSYRDVQELLDQRGIQITLETLREWCIKFGPLFAQDLRYRDTDVAKHFLTRPFGEYDVPEVIHTDQLQSYGAAIRQIASLIGVDHQHVISTAHCNNVIEQQHRSTRRQERSQQGFRRRKRAQEFLSLHARITNLHHHTRTSVSAKNRRSNQKQALQMWSVVAAGVA